LCRSIRQRGKVEPVYVKDVSQLPERLAELIQPGDIVLTQGAGNVGGLAKVLNELQLDRERMQAYEGAE
jgi:UDP-N-acetylmuramate--alanine ligase